MHISARPLFIFIRHISNHGCVGCARLSQSHRYLCSWGLANLPPSRSANYLEYTRSGRWCPKA
ncbi:hypothetical protein CWN41_03320 [Klebsiella quasipneumoniae]|nr:hypothetical protein CWN41_03320 [Klebsiella quasipneumoniae]